MQSTMNSEWPKITLTDIYEIRSGLSKPKSEFGSGYDFVSFKDVLDNYFLPKYLNSLVQSSEKEQENCSVVRGDVFLTRTSETQDELAMSSVAIRDYENATFNGFTKRLRPKNENIIHPEYAAYFFRSPRFRQQVNSMATLSTRASLNNEMISKLYISVPPLNTQKAIGKILKTLDDKIELNRQTNKPLESLARAIFKSWFVDFDPVRVKRDGSKNEGDKATPYSLSPDILDLFPDSFQDSELGEIPVGWEVGQLNAIGKNVRDSVSANDLNDADNYIGLEHIPRKSISLHEWESSDIVTSNKYRFDEGDVLFGKLRPYFHKVGIPPIAGICSTDILVWRAKNSNYQEYLLMYLSSNELVEYATQVSTGTRMPRANWKDLEKYPIVNPGPALIEEFSKLVKPMVAKIHSNIWDEHGAYQVLGIDEQEKAFYDILRALTVKYDFLYPDEKLIPLSKEVKTLVEDKTRYTDWQSRDDIKAELKVDLILKLAQHGYPPVDREEVYKEIFEQAENYKRHRTK